VWLASSAASGCALFWTGTSARARRDVLGGRMSLTPEEVRANYYAGTSVALAAIHAALHEIGSCLQVPPGQLRPTDRLSIELAPPRGWDWDDGLAVLRRLAKRRLELCGRRTEDAATIVTVDDYVRLCALEE
jgi:hypothetical protein